MPITSSLSRFRLRYTSKRFSSILCPARNFVGCKSQVFSAALKTSYFLEGFDCLPIQRKVIDYAACVLFVEFTQHTVVVAQSDPVVLISIGCITPIDRCSSYRARPLLCSTDNSRGVGNGARMNCSVGFFPEKVAPVTGTTSLTGPHAFGPKKIYFGHKILMKQPHNDCSY